MDLNKGVADHLMALLRSMYRDSTQQIRGAQGRHSLQIHLCNGVHARELHQACANTRHRIGSTYRTSMAKTLQKNRKLWQHYAFNRGWTLDLNKGVADHLMALLRSMYRDSAQQRRGAQGRHSLKVHLCNGVHARELHQAFANTRHRICSTYRT